MENKITMPRLAAMLALATGKQKKLCEDFLRELFRIVADELENGENVRIKGFGTFKLVAVEARRSVNVSNGEAHEIPGHSKVMFVPAKELAGVVNSAFDAFEAVEIADEVSDDMLDGNSEVENELMEMDRNASREEEKDDEASAEAYSEVSPEQLAGSASDDDDSTPAAEYSPSDSGNVADDGMASLPDSLPDEVISIDPDAEVEEETAEGESLEAEYVSSHQAASSSSYSNEEYEMNDSPEFEGETSHDSTHRFGWGFFAGFVTAVVALGLVITVAWYVGFPRNTVETEQKDAGKTEGVIIVETRESGGITLTEEEKHNADTIVKAPEKVAADQEEVPTRPSDEPVYDVVTTTHYLTTIAKEHYGNFNLWPIIYEENKAILGHPDRIRPGTRVVVPPLSKYGIDPKNPAHVKEAKRKGEEIYSRYR